MNQTSRLYILDLVEAIINQIQFASHCQELIHFYSIEFVKTKDEAYLGMLSIQEELLHKSIDIRRNMMESLRDTFEDTFDQKMWCSLKHALASYGFILEVSYAVPSSGGYKMMAQEAYEQLMKTLSIFLGLPEIVVCGRCLCDQIIEQHGG